MDTAAVFALAFVIGVLDGLRAFTPPAVVSWAARLKWLNLQGTGLAFLGYAATPYLFTVIALAELVNDKLPTAGSRKAPGPFAGRIVLGGLSGAALVMAAKQSVLAGLVFGALGAVAGTLGGYEARTRLVKALHTPDFAVALLEDAIAIGGSLFVVTRLS